MTFLEFDELSNRLFDEVKQMRDTKGKEYAGTEDRFDNFNRLAKRTGLDRKTIWLVYFTKHMDAIESYIKNGRTFSAEGIHGRIVDAITYLSLLDGMITEELNTKSETFKYGSDGTIMGPESSYRQADVQRADLCGYISFPKGICIKERNHFPREDHEFRKTWITTHKYQPAKDSPFAICDICGIDSKYHQYP